MSIAISIRNLYKSFDDGKTFVVNDLSLDIPENKITFIIGYSGTGKSVLLRHILGLVAPNSGSIKIFGQNIWDISPEDLIKLRTDMGVLFQYAALFDDMTVLENVCFPLFVHNFSKKAKSEIHDIAHNKLKISGLDSVHYHKYPNELSGGMRKRVGLARALALDPKILFYDEPTTGLDPVLTEMVNNLIYQTHKNQKTTSLVISHDLIASFNIADHIIMLDKGRLVLSGNSEDFLTSDLDLVKEFINRGLRLYDLENSRV